MKTFVFVKFALPLLALVLLFSAFALPPRWEYLGQRKVNYGIDRDEIVVTYREGKFNAIKLLVKHADLNMTKCTVHFENGGTQDVETRFRIPAGGESRVIDLDGRGRFIEKIIFWYDTKNSENRKAVVEVWGRHAGR